MTDENLICEHISVSRKQTWSDCQAKYKFRYHLKLIPDGPVQPYFVYGKLIHKIAEIYVKEQGKKDIDTIARECLNGTIKIEDKQTAPPSIDSSYQKKLPTHIRSIKQVSDRIGYDGELEWPFHFDLQPPDEHFITGFIDRLIERKGNYFILDYKTTKKGFYRKNKNTIRTDLQLRCYARVVQRTFNVPAEKIRAALYYLEGNEIVDTKFTEHSLITAEQELHDAYKEIRSTHPDEVYGRVNDQCRRCEYKKVCPFYSLT